MRAIARFVVCLGITAAAGSIALGAEMLEPVRISDDGRGFVLTKSGRPFVVWGLNYDHDASGRLIEDYWHKEWPAIETDFAEMKALGANVVRVHLQFGKFIDESGRPVEPAVLQLRELVSLAERIGLYLDITGLGCYHKRDVPSWYDALDEADRWNKQARFWETIAETCANSPAVFCYDLMNEPVVPGAGPARADWLGPDFAGKHFVQFITRDLAGRERPEVAKQWIAALSAAIRKHDRDHLITVGLVPWSLDRPGLTSGFVPAAIAGQLDFLAVHIYPETAKLAEADDTLRGFLAAGKPVIVEEIFPLKCSAGELDAFITRHQDVQGWVGFYWGQTAEECRRTKTIAGAITANWLELFERRALHGPTRKRGS